MKRKNNEPKYTINDILNIQTGQLYLANDLLNVGEYEKFKLRRRLEENIQSKIDELVCAICRQKIKLKAGIEKIPYFAHYKDSADCPIKTGASFSEGEKQKFIFQNIRESRRHIQLKERLHEILSIDNSFSNPLKEKVIMNDLKKWRKPDLQCEYKGRKIVFEIQLSYTFLSIIVARENFYKDIEIPIYWIFDNFDPDFVRYFECDIFYHHNCNILVFDDAAYERSKKEKKLILKIYHLIPILQNSTLFQKWIERPLFVYFSEITYNNGRSFFYDYDNAKKELLSSLDRKKMFDFLGRHERQSLETDKFMQIINSIFNNYFKPGDYDDISRLKILFCTFYSIQNEKIYGYKGNSIVWLLNIICDNYEDVLEMVVDFINGNKKYRKYVRNEDHNKVFSTRVNQFRTKGLIENKRYIPYLSYFFPEIRGKEVENV